LKFLQWFNNYQKINKRQENKQTVLQLKAIWLKQQDAVYDYRSIATFFYNKNGSKRN